jgi:hypothetical protein
MQLISTRNISYMLVAVFGLGLATLSIASPSGGHGGGPLRDADANGDGLVSQEEFSARRNNHFSEAETDGAAGLSLAEFTALHEKREAERRAQRSQRRFERLDANSDGVIDEAEFAARADKMFSRLDADEDGSLSAEELKHARMAGQHGGHKRPMGYHHQSDMPPPPVR